MYPAGSEAEMADVHYTHDMGAQSYAAPSGVASTATASSLTNMTNVAGAVVSLALIVGVGIWGYKLMARDVSGIPVVKAATGEMRVRPEQPGGQLALNQGLAVNAVAAEGSAEAPADRLVLAPRPVDLTEEDAPMTAATVAPVQQSQPQDVDVAAALEAGSVEDLVSRLTAGVAPIDAEDTGAAPEVETRVASIVQPAPVTPVIENAVLDKPGVRQSLRPRLRPAAAPAVVVPVRAEAVTSAQTNELDAASLPAGTRLVQLGAFDSAEVARDQWAKIEGRFGDYLSGKDRIVQKAQSGGRTFYRLRAHGFADLSDARRFCSALVAEGADCIPVVTR